MIFPSRSPPISLSFPKVKAGVTQEVESEMEKLRRDISSMRTQHSREIDNLLKVHLADKHNMLRAHKKTLRACIQDHDRTKERLTTMETRHAKDILRLHRQLSSLQRELEKLKETNEKTSEKVEDMRIRKNRFAQQSRDDRKRVDAMKLKMLKQFDKAARVKEDVERKLTSKIDENLRLHQSMHCGVEIRAGGRGDPFTPEFEHFAKQCMATGISAQGCLDQMESNVRFWLGEKAASSLRLKLPGVRWLQSIREQVGNESWLYSFIKIAGADEIFQHGFDETQIDRVSACNQWCLIRTGKSIEVVYIETGGLLIGGTAEEMKDHVKMQLQLCAATLVIWLIALFPSAAGGSPSSR